MRIVLLGAPGSGKGTQAAALSRRLDLPHICVGDLLREAMTQATPRAVRLRRSISRGELVSDTDVLAVIWPHVAERSEYILDGFPRTLSQAQLAFAMDDGAAGIPDAAIYLRVDSWVLMERLRWRREGRIDDIDEVIRKRMAVFNAETVPVIRAFADSGVLAEVNAAQPAHAVTRDILTTLSGNRDLVMSGDAAPRRVRRRLYRTSY
jgi:adenylate kinase